MSLPGTGLLAALRRRNAPPAAEPEPPTPDAAKFVARSSAVQAMEQAVAAGPTPERPKKQAAGRAIKPGGQLTYDLDDSHPGEEQLELASIPVTRVPAEYREAHLRQVAISDQFITYGLKQGHIRVLHRFSEARALLKGHAGPVSDIRFVGDDVLAAGGQDGQLFVWRVQVVDGDSNALHVPCMLHIKFTGCDAAPVLLAGADPAVGGTLVVAVGSAVLALTVPSDGENPIWEVDLQSPQPHARKMAAFPASDQPTAVAVSPDGKMVAAGSQQGAVHVSWLQGDMEEVPSASSIAPQGSAVSAVEWMAAGEDGYTLLISSHNGAQHTLYHCSATGEGFAAGGSVRLQAAAGQPTPFVHTAVVREQSLVLLADTRRKGVYALHWSGAGAAAEFDYFTRFKVGLPVLNFACVWDADAGEEGAVEINCVQTEAVQQYHLDPQLCYDQDAVPAEAAAPPAAAREEGAPSPGPPSGVPLPSPGLANGTSTPPPATEPLVTTDLPEPAEQPAQPAPPPLPLSLTLPEPSEAGHPKLLTPKDLLNAAPPPALERAASGAAAGVQQQPAVRILQRPVAEEPLPSSTPTPTPTPVPEVEVEVEAPPAAAAAATAGTVASAVAEEMSGVHRKFAGHVSAMYKELLKAMKSEMAAQAAAQQAATAALVRELLAAQAAAVQAERAAVLASEHSAFQNVLASISNSLNQDLPARLQEAMRGELASMGIALSEGVAPAVREAVQASLPKDVAAALKAGLDKQLQAALSKPLNEAFRTSFMKQIVPSFESAVQAMFQQMNTALAAGFEQHATAARATMAEPAALAGSLREVLASAQALTEGLRQEQAGGASAATSASGLRSPSAADTRAQLTALLAGGRHEEAFSRALGLQDVATVAWLCSQPDAAAALSAEPPLLSQTVLLSLVQQLAVDLSSSTTTKLQWIREATMMLDPRDPHTAPHLRGVLEQVVASLQGAAGRLKGADASSAKLAMHVVRSQMAG